MPLEDKEFIRQGILRQLRIEHQNAIRSARVAHEAATNDESKAENKYDTRGLEASYLAEGQSRRVAELEDALAVYEKIELIQFDDDTPVRITALVTLEDEHEDSQDLFIGPLSGGLKIKSNEREYLLVTPNAPLGSALIGKRVGDEVTINTPGSTRHYEIINIC